MAVDKNRFLSVKALIKSDTFSGTTDSSGNISIGNKIVLAAKDSSGNCYNIWYGASGSANIKAYTTTNGTLTVRANTAVSGTYWYIPFP